MTKDEIRAFVDQHFDPFDGVRQRTIARKDTNMKTPAYSAGARYERKAVRVYLERKVKAYGRDSSYAVLLAWMRSRQTRYDKKAGGL